MKRKSELAIGRRAAEEVRRLFPKSRHIDICRRLGCNKKTLSLWNDGFAPSAMFLSRIASLGGDVDYILTGNRRTKDNPPEFLAELEEEY